MQTSRKANTFICFLFHGTFNVGVLGVEKFKSHDCIMFSIEKVEDIINISSVEVHRRTLIVVEPYVFIMP